MIYLFNLFETYTTFMNHAGITNHLTKICLSSISQENNQNGQLCNNSVPIALLGREGPTKSRYSQ